MKKIKYYGKFFSREDNSWRDIDPEKAIFVMDDDMDPFEFLKCYFPDEMPYLLTYVEIKE